MSWAKQAHSELDLKNTDYTRLNDPTCSICTLLCAVLSVSYVQYLACVMRNLQSVLCVTFSVPGLPLKRLTLRQVVRGAGRWSELVQVG